MPSGVGDHFTTASQTPTASTSHLQIVELFSIPTCIVVPRNCATAPKTFLEAEDGTDHIFDTIYKLYPLSAVSLMFKDLKQLISCCRGDTESYRNFKARFGSQLSKFNTLVSSVSMASSMAALFILANSKVDGAQRI